MEAIAQSPFTESNIDVFAPFIALAFVIGIIIGLLATASCRREKEESE